MSRRPHTDLYVYFYAHTMLITIHYTHYIYFLCTYNDICNRLQTLYIYFMYIHC